MSKLAAYSFGSGFIGGYNKDVEREQERADKLTNAIQEAQIKALMNQQVVYDKRQKTLKEAERLLSAGGEQNAATAHAMIASMDGYKDAYDLIIDTDKNPFGKNQEAKARQMIEDAKASQGDRPDFTGLGVMDNWGRVRRRQFSFEKSFRSMLGFGDEDPTPSHYPSADSGLYSPRNPPVDDIGIPQPQTMEMKPGEEATPEATPMPDETGRTPEATMMGESVMGETVTPEDTGGDATDFMTSAPPDLSTKVMQAVDPVTGATKVRAYVHDDQGRLVNKIDYGELKPASAPRAINKEERESIYGSIQAQVNRWSDIDQYEDLADVMSEDMNEENSPMAGIFWGRMQQLRTMPAFQQNPAGAADVVLGDLQDMWEYGFIEKMDEGWFGTGGQYTPKSPAQISAQIARLRKQGVITDDAQAWDLEYRFGVKSTEKGSK